MDLFLKSVSALKDETPILLLRFRNETLEEIRYLDIELPPLKKLPQTGECEI